MVVNVDEARRDDETGTIDRPVAGLRGLCANGNDRIAHDAHVRHAQRGASAVSHLGAHDRPGCGRLSVPDLHEAGHGERKHRDPKREIPQTHARLVYPSTRTHSDVPPRPGPAQRLTREAPTMTLVRIATAVVLASALLMPATAQESTADKVPARLTAERVAALPAAQRPAWTAYLEASDATRAADRAAMDGELRTAGRTQLTRAPLGPSMDPWLDKTDGWYASDDARRIADAVISYQAPSGGWSKRLDFAAGSRQPGQGYSAEGDWSYVATFDNDATVSQMQFLSRVFDAAGRTTDQVAFERGLAYILRAQYPNGCWPQGYPLAGSYHDAATFNDDAMANVIGLLDAVAQGRHRIVGADRRERRACQRDEGYRVRPRGAGPRRRCSHGLGRTTRCAHTRARRRARLRACGNRRRRQCPHRRTVDDAAAQRRGNPDGG